MRSILVIAVSSVLLWSSTAATSLAASSVRAPERNEVALIDVALPDSRSLEAGVAPGVKVVRFDSRRDGLADIARWAAGQKELDAIHVLSHGSAGVVNLGTVPLTRASLELDQTRSQLAALGSALKKGGDLLFYGCEVADGVGLGVLQAIADATGADVAASADLTGAANRGGNWVLESHIGRIEAQSPLSDRAMADYDGLLLTGNGTADGTYDFGGTFGTASGGFRKIADKLKVSDFLTRDSGTTQLYIADMDGSNDGEARSVVFKAEGTAVAKTFTFNDFTFSAYPTGQPTTTRTIDQLTVVLADVNGNTITTLQMQTATAILQPTATKLSTLINGGVAFSVANVASVNITISLWKSTDHGGDGGSPADINFDAITLSNISASVPNVAPTFVGASTALSVGQNSGNVDVRSLLHASDSDTGQTLTWTQSSAPGHGTLSFSGATGSSGNTDITPGGTIAYAPTAGYAGTDSFTVQVSDGTSNAIRTITVNITPTAPGAPDLAAGSDKGSSPTDNRTNEGSLTFSGTSAAGDTTSSVRVFLDANNNATYDNGEATATATLSNGAWTVTGLSTSGVTDGTYTVYAITTSAVGALISAPSSGLAMIVDKTAPGAPTSPIALSAASDSGSSNSDGRTNVTNPVLRVTLAGTNAVAGDTVELLLGGASLGTPVTAVLTGTDIANGFIDLAVTSGALGADGNKTFTGRITDVAGNLGAVGGSSTVVLDTTAPATPVTPVLDLASDSGSSNSDRITSNTTPVINGTAESGSLVTLYDSNGTTPLGSAVATGGAWSITTSTLADGIHNLTVKARDAAGNVSAASGPLSITIDTRPLVFTSATAGDGQVTLAWTSTAASVIGVYTVTGTPAGTCTTSTTSCIVSGLTNGTTYQFTGTVSGGGGIASASISATPVRTEYTGPVLNLGNAAVAITGGGTHCTLTSAGFNAVVPPNAPAGATQPVGVFRFTAEGCPGDTLSVSLTYPQPLPAAVRFLKFGPPAAGQPVSWFELKPADYALSNGGRTVTYTVTDNQAGDSNTVAGVIDDPFAPMVLLAPAGVTGVPTLSQWGLMLMSLLVGLMAWRMRRVG